VALNITQDVRIKPSLTRTLEKFLPFARTSCGLFSEIHTYTEKTKIGGRKITLIFKIVSQTPKGSVEASLRTPAVGHKCLCENQPLAAYTCSLRIDFESNLKTSYQSNDNQKL